MSLGEKVADAFRTGIKAADAFRTGIELKKSFDRIWRTAVI